MAATSPPLPPWTGESVDLLVLDDADNVGTALRTLDGTRAAIVARATGDRSSLDVAAPIPFGHKAALCLIPQGGLVIKHGRPIGRATADIAPGAHVHTHNVVSLSMEPAREHRAASVGSPA